ncbi:MAG: TIM barrel protein [Adhaeribacter sp.]
MNQNRRDFIKNAGLAVAGLGLAGTLPGLLTGCSASSTISKKEFYQISLAQWSLHKALFSGQLTNLEFPLKAKNDFGISIVEYVSPFFQKKEKERSYLKELKKITEDNGITNHLIMVDGEGNLGDTDAAKRKQAVENHHKWVDAAEYLGCKTIRVNAAGRGSAEEVKQAAIDGLGQLAEYGRKNKINVIVENHGSYSSNGEWLASVIKAVDNPYCGTLPDFGNFRISGTETYDRYQGVEELLPYAKGLSAKTYDFDMNGNETTIDYKRMLSMVRKAGWTGIIGIEYEGNRLGEEEGIRATKALLERLRSDLT